MRQKLNTKSGLLASTPRGSVSPFGIRSRQQLADLVFRQQVVVEWSKRDRYGRIVGKVFVGDRDACFEQVTAGLAWHYKAYQREQSPKDQAAYAAAEDAARKKRTGLWQDPTPIAPWDHRQRRRANFMAAISD